MQTRLKPTGKRALVEVAPIQPTNSLIEIPETVQQASNEGVIVRLGEPNDDLKEGDKVLFNRFGGTALKLEGRDCKLLDYSELIAVIGETEKECCAC